MEKYITQKNAIITLVFILVLSAWSLINTLPKRWYQYNTCQNFSMRIHNFQNNGDVLSVGGNEQNIYCSEKQVHKLSVYKTEYVYELIVEGQTQNKINYSSNGYSYFVRTWETQI